MSNELAELIAQAKRLTDEMLKDARQGVFERLASAYEERQRLLERIFANVEAVAGVAGWQETITEIVSSDKELISLLQLVRDGLAEELRKMRSSRKAAEGYIGGGA